MRDEPAPTRVRAARPRIQGEAERRLHLLIPTAVRETRLALRLNQTELAERCGLTQTLISHVERGDLARLNVEQLGHLLDGLGLRMDLALHRPFIAAPPFQQDAAHARALAYVAGRLRTMGWQAKLEIEIGEGRARGWIDLLAFREAERALFIVEVKAGLDDVGSAQRQLGWYERAALETARSFGWRITRSASALLVLATTANDSLLSANHGLLAHALPVRARGLFEWLREPDHMLAGPALALIDRTSRRRHWPIPTALDGRRSPLRYAGYQALVRPASPRPRARRCP